MAERKPLSKKLRFEVFKRDAFTCQYCGKKAPDVVLEVDHIKPVSKGGKNELLNLVTACFECNRGKRNIELSDRQELEVQRKQLEELNTKREQMKMMLEWKEELLAFQKEQVKEIEKLFENPFDLWTVFGFEEKMLSLIDRFGFLEVYESTKISIRKYIKTRSGKKREEEVLFAINKIGGICYNRKINKEREW